MADIYLQGRYRMVDDKKTKQINVFWRNEISSSVPAQDGVVGGVEVVDQTEEQVAKETPKKVSFKDVTIIGESDPCLLLDNQADERGTTGLETGNEEFKTVKSKTKYKDDSWPTAGRKLGLCRLNAGNHLSDASGRNSDLESVHSNYMTEAGSSVNQEHEGLGVRRESFERGEKLSADTQRHQSRKKHHRHRYKPRYKGENKLYFKVWKRAMKHVNKEFKGRIKKSTKDINDGPTTVGSGVEEGLSSTILRELLLQSSATKYKTDIKCAMMIESNLDRDIITGRTVKAMAGRDKVIFPNKELEQTTCTTRKPSTFCTIV